MMTKKEQAAMEAALTAASLRATEGCEPDVMPPTYGQPLSVGWAVVGCGTSARTEPACSSPCYHATGYIDRTTTQLSIRLHSTRIKALKAARREVEKECCAILRRIDKHIEQETANPSKLPEVTK